MGDDNFDPVFMARVCLGCVKCLVYIIFLCVSLTLKSYIEGMPYVVNDYCRVIFYQYDTSYELNAELSLLGGGRIVSASATFLDYTLIGNRNASCDDDCFVGLTLEDGEPGEDFNWVTEVNLAGTDPGGCSDDDLCDGDTCTVLMRKGDDTGVSGAWFEAPIWYWFGIRLALVCANAVGKADSESVTKFPSGNCVRWLMNQASNVVLYPLSQMTDTKASPSHLVTRQGDLNNLITWWSCVVMICSFLYIVVRHLGIRVVTSDEEKFTVVAVSDGIFGCMAAVNCICNWCIMAATGCSFLIFLTLSFSFELWFPSFEVNQHITAVKVLLIILMILDSLDFVASGFNDSQDAQ